MARPGWGLTSKPKANTVRMEFKMGAIQASAAVTMINFFVKVFRYLGGLTVLKYMFNAMSVMVKIDVDARDNMEMTIK